MTKVSVIIPAYNAMPYLPQTVESVLQQTFNNFEVLIIDDASTDETVEWASQLEDRRVSLIQHDQNQGLATTRNMGINRAKGDYIAFLDADDVWEPTKLSKQIQVLNRDTHIGLIYTSAAIINEEGQTTGRMFKAFKEGNVWELLIQGNFVDCPSSVMVRRECFDQVGLFDINFRCVEDWEMWIRIAKRYRFAAIHEPLVKFRMVSNSLSKNYHLMETSFHQVINKVFQSVDTDLLPLKKRSCSHANMVIAWKALQSKDKNVTQASKYKHLAFKSYPLKVLTKEYFRLSTAIALMHWFGPEKYEKLMNMLYVLRRRIALN
ncbi:glycosyltransferase [Acaryochloris sp. IP29b_bin.137]|uniref:glycosyltransferase family 2 protein n=1 Tax=Acaryochloris sp. IP29b_bin.137 TaxID=2969217 RepID=UPI002612F441|nr:glycosyltransferase [Acaryochloris sp. IP29b_bin.137]